MQPNQNIFTTQSAQQNCSTMQQETPVQQNYPNINNQIQQNPQIQENYQMQQEYPVQSNLNQQNFQMQNPQMPYNPQMQSNPQMQYNQGKSPNQQIEMEPNPQVYPNQQNIPIQSNPSIQENPRNQQYNPPYAGQQSRPLPPPLPRNSSQNFYQTIQHNSSQRIPLRSTASSKGSNGLVTLQQSMQFNSMASMQSIGSSDDEIPYQQQQNLLPSQVFSVVYNNVTYKVDPELLSNASSKVKEMILPYIQENRLNDAHLIILEHNFTQRNINNFLKLCQNLPTDVENSEMEEICEIAKMFGAEKIYNTGVSFIRENMNPNFTVPDNKYDGSDGKKHLIIDDDQHSAIDHSSDIPTNMVNDENEANNDEDEEDEVDNNEIKQNLTTPSLSTSNKESEDSQTSSKVHSVIYTVRAERHALKCPVFRFSDPDDNNVLFTAKQKDSSIYIGEGYDVHIKKNQKNHVAHISQDNCFHNIIFFRDKNFKLKYVDSGKPNHLSINVSFPMNGKMITWNPKPPKYDSATDKYYLNFKGEHHHTPMKSKKNIVLQNENGHPTFIVRKMYYDKYEIECLPMVDPLIAFVIGLSDIVGPYMDPLGEIFN